MFSIDILSFILIVQMFFISDLRSTTIKLENSIQELEKKMRTTAFQANYGLYNQ
jgi:hypothetical protein